MKYRDENGNIKELRLKAQDNLPIGAIVDYEGENVPEGYVEVEDEGEIYSTEERRIGTWIDGKPLYRKVIDCGTLPNTTSKNVNYNINNLDLIVECLAISNSPTGATNMPIPWADLYINKSNGTFKITTSGNQTVFNKTYVIMKYTKTTD